MEFIDSLVLSAHDFISRTPSLLVAMNLDDALGLRAQQNLPGVETGHPNWRRKYPLSAEDIFAPGGKAFRRFPRSPFRRGSPCHWSKRRRAAVRR